MLKALNYGRTTLFIHKIPIIFLSPSLDNPIKIYEYSIQNHQKLFVTGYVNTQDLNEPQVPLTTIILADTTEIAKILRMYSWRDYDNIVFKTSFDHKLKIKFISSETFEVTIDKSIARALEGDAFSTYNIRLLLECLTILRKLGVNRIRMMFSKDSPMLLTPFSRTYPKIWMAPNIID